MVRSTRVALLCIVICASGTSAPDTSVTVPEMEEVSDWARIEVAVTNRQTMTINTTRILNLWSLTSASKESVQGCFMIALSQRSTVYTFCYNVVNRKGDEFVDN